MGYKKEAMKGVGWVGAFRVVSRGMSFLRTAILARILSPEQFGTYGIGLLVLALLEVFTETGINVFLVQQKGKIDKYVNTSWVISIVRGVLISLLTLLSIPLVTSFFREPGAQSILIVISMVPVFRGFINPGIVLFQKDLRFSMDFLLQTARFGVDTVVAIMVARATESELALAWGLMAGVVTEVVLSHAMVSLRPRLSFDAKKARQIIGTGKWVTGAGIFDWSSQNADDAVVGRFLGTSSLGFYQMAYKLSTLPIREITQVVGRVTLPVYVKIANKARLKCAFIKTLASVTLLSGLASVAIFLFAETLVSVILGPGWEPAVPVVRVLALFGFIRAVIGVFYALFLATKKERWVTLVTMVELVGLLATVVPLTARFGIIGAAYAAIVSAVVTVPFVVYFYTQSFDE